MAYANYCDSIKFMDNAFIDMKTQSAKAKGRRLQQWFRDLLIEKLDVHPYSIECKNQENVNVWKAYDQAKENSGDYEPIVVLKRNNTKPLVLVDADYFVRLHNELVD